MQGLTMPSLTGTFIRAMMIQVGGVCAQKVVVETGEVKGAKK
jgi:hypothetical protein